MRLELSFFQGPLPDLYEVYSWFTEGFDTHDLRVLKALLDGISLG
ncbi:MAG: hypothetical protein P1S60_20455 [Anaerolineae bacterium]|nr:hypothetical protein [Anaerolineae bacterium]